MHLLRVTDPSDVERVCSFLTSVRVRAVPEGGGLVSVSVPRALSALHERRELAGCVATWNALNPASPVELVEPPA